MPFLYKFLGKFYRLLTFYKNYDKLLPINRTFTSLRETEMLGLIVSFAVLYFVVYLFF